MIRFIKLPIPPQQPITSILLPPLIRRYFSKLIKVTQPPIPSNLKSPEFLSMLLSQQQHLITTQPIKSYSPLRDHMNELVKLAVMTDMCKHYHLHKWTQIRDTIQTSLKQVQHLFKFSFIKVPNSTHQDTQQQRHNYRTLAMSHFLKLSHIYNLAPSLPILTHYANSYVHILKDHNRNQYLDIYEIVRQLKREYEGPYKGKEVMDMLEVLEEICGKEIGKWSGKLEEAEMGLLVGLVRLVKYSQQLSSNQHQTITDLLLSHLHSKSQQSQQSQQPASLQQQPLIIYTFYLLLNLSHPSPSLSQQIYNTFMKFMKNTHFEDGHFRDGNSFLVELNSHEDKLSCLKLEVWLGIIKIQAQMEGDSRPAGRMRGYLWMTAQGVKGQFWGYRYLLWLCQLLPQLAPSQSQCLSKQAYLLSQLSHQQLSPSNPLSSLLYFLQTLNSSNLQTLQLHQQSLSWLTNLPKSSLLTQPPTILTQILQLPQHPSLIPIYKPYLQKLLEISLGQFLWQDYTKLYYYGLIWVVCDMKGDCPTKWNMQYVRRYILNQYIAMGITRRQIHTQSYFYKILKISTPEEFYKDYVKYDTKEGIK